MECDNDEDDLDNDGVYFDDDEVNKNVLPTICIRTLTCTQYMCLLYISGFKGGHKVTIGDFLWVWIPLAYFLFSVCIEENIHVPGQLYIIQCTLLHILYNVCLHHMWCHFYVHFHVSISHRYDVTVCLKNYCTCIINLLPQHILVLFPSGHPCLYVYSSSEDTFHTATHLSPSKVARIFCTRKTASTYCLLQVQQSQ